MNEIMSIYNGSIILISILIFLLGSVAVKSARSGGARAFIIVAAFCSYVALFIGPLQLLSYAKPVSLEWINKDIPDAEVLHAELREGDGIYLLLDWYGVPRYYKLAWDATLAQQLIEAMEQAHGEAGGEQRPGSAPPQESQQGQDGGQGLVDQLLGPQGDNEGDGTQLNAPQHLGEMQNAGNGKVMMRNPFDTEGENETGSEYEDTPSELMFYAVPQVRYPEKVAPE